MVTSADLQDSDGLIDMSRFPYRSYSLGIEWVAQQAALARRLGAKTSSVTSEVHGNWQSLGEYHSAPEASDLRGKMAAVKTGGQDEYEAFFTGADHMDAWVEEVSACKLRLGNVEREAESLRRSVAMRGESWVVTRLAAAQDLQARQLVEYHEELLALARTVMGQLQAADEELARKLHGQGQGSGAGGFRLFGDAGLGFPSRPGSQGFVPTEKWLRTASPEAVLAWWDGLPSWQRELMKDAIDESDLPPVVRRRLVTDALVGAGAMDAEASDAQALVLATELFGGPKVMPAAVASAGGAAVVGAMSTIGASAYDDRDDEVYGAAALAALVAVRAGVVGASRVWDRKGSAGQAKAEKFARDMMVGVNARRDGAPVGFLFAGGEQELMGRELTVAVADELDYWERGTGVVPSQRGIAYLADQPGAGGAGEKLWWDESTVVLSTLAEYPDAALDWLTAEGADPITGMVLGDERVAHYFSEVGMDRQGRVEVVADLWSGAQYADGSLLGSGRNAETQIAVADLSTLVFEQLAANEGLVPERITPQGAERLAEAMMQQLPQFAVNGVIGGPSGNYHADVMLVGGDERVPVVNATQRELARALGPVLAHESGMEVANRAVEDFNERVRASFGNTSELESADNADLLFQVDGALEGARLVAVSEEALRVDQRVEGAVDLGTSTLAAGAKKVAPEVVVNWSMDKINEIADAHLATQVEEVQQSERARLAGMADQLASKSAVAYDAYIGAHGQQSLSVTAFAERKNTEFSNAYGAWINRAEQEGESGT
ncbi:hypothetical protein [Promicromonospora sp. NPDC023987]|uniref:hypothetical protein n=1 Tax=Promicromonospora sp. NPDC023987 TaxID=3155360 RepID=UPI0033E6BB6A